MRRKGWPPLLFDENPLYIRTSSLYTAHHKDGINNATRSLFKQAVLNLFQRPAEVCSRHHEALLDVDALSATADGLVALAAEWRGDGEKWTPTITVKGGTSGFYTIKVEK